MIEVTPERLVQLIGQSKTSSGDPVHRFILDQGVSPEEGWKLVLPMYCQKLISSEYIEFSHIIDRPLLVNTQLPCSFLDPLNIKEISNG